MSAAAAAGRPLRVLFLTGFPAIGGPLPKLAPVVAEGLRRGGCEVSIAGWSAHSARPEPFAVKVRDRSGDLWRVRERVRTWRPDVVFVATTHNRSALMRDIPLALALPAHLPLVLHFHGSECGLLGAPGKRLLTQSSLWLAERAAAVLLLSREEYGAWTHACPRARFELVDNPYVGERHDDAAPRPERGADDPMTVLFVGRLVPDKGIFELLDAVDVVRRRLPVRLVVAGAGPAEGDLRRRIALLGLETTVTLRGYVSGDDLDAVYRQADVFALPSYREGFPLVVMEAMDYGLPVVTTPIRGCADHLEPFVNAVFAPPRDAEALANALLAVLEDGALRRTMGEANRLKVMEFAPERVLPRYVDILRDVVRAGGGEP